MKYIILGLVLLISYAGFAQQNDALTYLSYIDTGDLRKHLYTIASAEMEGRETATKGQQKAAAYIENHFRMLGLDSAAGGKYQQSFPVYRDSITSMKMEVAGIPLKADTNFAVSRDSKADILLSGGEVLFVGFGITDSTHDDYKDTNAKGRIVMVMPGAVPVKIKGKKRPGKIPDVQTLQQSAADNGATALLIVDARFPRNPTPVKGPMYFNKEEKDAGLNTFFISDSVAMMILGNDYAAIKKTMKTGYPSPKSYYVPIKLELIKQTEQLESTNVLGILEGTSKKDEAVVITSHYDHMGMRDSLIFYGADDDGSGTVTVLELAEAFSKAADAGMRPLRSVIFMTVSGEEKGLWGSEYYVMNPVIPMEKTSVNINIDMIGRVESGKRADSLNYVYVVGDNRLSSDLRTISEAANRKLYNFTLDYKFNDPQDPQRIFYRSDHYNFAKHGVPAIFYFNGLHEDYHRPTDTPDKINYSLLSKRAHLIFATAWEMANREEMLKRDLP